MKVWQLPWSSMPGSAGTSSSQQQGPILRAESRQEGRDNRETTVDFYCPGSKTEAEMWTPTPNTDGPSHMPSKTEPRVAQEESEQKLLRLKLPLAASGAPCGMRGRGEGEVTSLICLSGRAQASSSQQQTSIIRIENKEAGRDCKERTVDFYWLQLQN